MQIIVCLCGELLEAAMPAVACSPRPSRSWGYGQEYESPFISLVGIGLSLYVHCASVCIEIVFLFYHSPASCLREASKDISLRGLRLILSVAPTTLRPDQVFDEEDFVHASTLIIRLKISLIPWRRMWETSSWPVLPLDSH
jgi:hypothetical protein